MTTAEIRAEITLWEAAVQAALAAGQSYAIDGRSMTRVPIETAVKQLNELRNRLSTRTSRSFVHARAVPR